MRTKPIDYLCSTPMPWPFEMTYLRHRRKWSAGSVRSWCKYLCMCGQMVVISVQMYDSFGDGWTTGSLDVYLSMECLSVETSPLSYGNFWHSLLWSKCRRMSAIRTTDVLIPIALNYNPLATEDDGSCYVRWRL
jgi:hypothetical protein